MSLQRPAAAKDFEGKPISGQLEEIIGQRKSLVASDGEKTFVRLTADDAGEYRQQAISTIICEGMRLAQ